MPSEDIALRLAPSGKFTFAWGKDGNPAFNRQAQYAMYSTLFTKKGWYYWDGGGKQGTLLHTVKQDRLTTGSQLGSYAADAGQQCQAAALITSLRAVPQRLRARTWLLDLHWEAAGQTVTGRPRL